MGTPKVVRSAEARKDVRDLYVWIVEDGGLERAERVVALIEAKLQRLAKRPLSGRPRSDLKGDPRSISVPPWVIVYEPLEGGAGIHLLRIVDSRRDVAALLGKKT
ncbi:type II toxin-antitoxin system RelE/ParE family toxin [Caulobacter sp. 1776]|uniref:type II toxin-antitoxin system RelE/ParE family toxin n=1 Tax=Caulobacter sp. 1776 TaxID=3156420 RepID=UPI0033917EB1